MLKCAEEMDFKIFSITHETALDFISQKLNEYDKKYYANAIRLSKKYETGHEIIILTGVEIRHPKGHILGVGYRRNRVVEKLANKPPRTLEEICRAIKQNGGLVIVPHPFNRRVGGISKRDLESILDKVDAIEIFNAQNVLFKKYDEEAKEFCKEYGVPGIASSDSHELSHIYKAFIEFYYPLDFSSGEALVQSMREAFRKGHYRNYGVYISKWNALNCYVFRRIYSPITNYVNRKKLNY